MLFTMREAPGPDGPDSLQSGRPSLPFRSRMLRQRLPVFLATVAVLTVLGPFGTFRELTLAERLAYWGGLIGFGSLAFELLTHAALRLLKDRAKAWRSMLAGVAAGTVLLVTLVVALLEWSVRGHDFLHPLGLAELMVYVTVVTALASAAPLWLELHGRGLLAPSAPAAATPPPHTPMAPQASPQMSPQASPRSEPAFFARLPAKLGRDLLALEMEDHYVRVHTAEGSDLILMRLRDAIAELSGLDGRQVHRSYWVAAAAVSGVERKPDGKLTLVLRNELRVPVSRSYAANVRAAGWAEKTGG
ncbi:LytTR family DNA-binding domain-containing protein [Azospirillum rugosum]|uniref:HTH LytTR-type domain-containing protein n=1 Tax=Azospirillum rugosum TaxID=416170 RepID=A0ABS4SST9_9PROT|nr:LytTR family DNA-binding domain-containing protein [Azospirillum rugosum]MBP2295626.1 hypothetical protein [Azospirillum rugosum]MDQ0529484.1 hypothetical protein [Azospirillum rugosum]